MDAFVVKETCQVDNYYTIINDISKRFSKTKQMFKQ